MLLYSGVTLRRCGRNCVCTRCEPKLDYVGIKFHISLTRVLLRSTVLPTATEKEWSDERPLSRKKLVNDFMRRSRGVLEARSTRLEGGDFHGFIFSTSHNLKSPLLQGVLHLGFVQDLASSVFSFRVSVLLEEQFVGRSLVDQFSSNPDAIQVELDSLYKRKVFGPIVHTPEAVKPVGNIWVFVRKRNEKNEIMIYKAKLVAQGFSQRPGIDYEETYSPVMDAITFRYLISLAVSKNLEMCLMDVVTAYL
ncbi:hypothetical protein OSB04_011541 [Centaurea solstitialis]|uniref:Reverse transcriptase Ty1/copia-type domain-containing protein n=1 Tax=Centaurea solstitialis TaxID=347529 RepID=A0AA38WD15_9ASTR|nr:hypothetical protein OSB04_011541 [Centaurea solstitialis]